TINTGQALGNGNSPPFITNISPTPPSVTSTDAVSVSAEVTDTDGVASVSLNWGTSSGNLTNTIAMSPGTGNLYTTISDIPAHPNTTTIYYQITATDSNASAATNTTGELNYTVQDPLPGGWQITSEDTVFSIDFDTTVSNVNNGKFKGMGFS